MYPLPTIYVLDKNKKLTKIFQLKIVIFAACFLSIRFVWATDRLLGLDHPQDYPDNRPWSGGLYSPGDQVPTRPRSHRGLCWMCSQLKRFSFLQKQCKFIFEPRCEKTGFLHMRKQRRRSAAQ